jgi:protein O-GlcNAc transferase
MIARRSVVTALMALTLTTLVSGCANAAAVRTGDAATEPQKKKSQTGEKSPQYQYEKGVIALRYGLTDEAIRYGKLGISLDPEHFNSWNLLGAAYYAKGEYGPAAEAYGKAAALKPDAADVQRNLGMAWIELKETEKASAALKRAFELGEDAEAAYYLGRLFYVEKRFDEALEYALKSIQKNGGSAKAYNLKGVILNQMGRYAEAAGSFQAGLVLAPEDIGLQVNLGIAFINANEPAKAKAVFEAVLPSIKEQVLKGQVENYLKSIKDAGK